MNIAIVGAGHVGLVSGVCFAETGSEIVCFDNDRTTIENLRNGIVPVYEPGLTDLIVKNQKGGRLKFTTCLIQALEQSEIIFIAIETPQRGDGSANLDNLWAVVDKIREAASSPKLVVLKNTVPAGTSQRVYERINQDSDVMHSVASNPEFLSRGTALKDALQPDRVVCGVQDGKSEQLLKKLYEPQANIGVPILFMEWESAEMTKYVANCFLATKLSFINEMANMCEALGADINDVRQGIGHDQRIGFEYFTPGVGYGGPCFPKDMRALKALAREKQMPMRILEAADYVNEDQKRVAFNKLEKAFNGYLKNATIAVWGLAFKPETDDTREAPALVLINQLIEAGAIVRAYDREAADSVEGELQDRVEFYNDPYDAAMNADALAIMTDWREIYSTDFAKLSRTMKGNVIFDGRNLFEPHEVAASGFVYSSVGRQTSFPGFTPQTVMSTAVHEPA